MLMHAKEFCGLVSDKTGPAATGLLATCVSFLLRCRRRAPAEIRGVAFENSVHQKRILIPLQGGGGGRRKLAVASEECGWGLRLTGVV